MGESEKPVQLDGLSFLHSAEIVEHRGFEPLTSSMPWKRATNCANAPLLVETSLGLAWPLRASSILGDWSHNHQTGVIPTNSASQPGPSPSRRSEI